MPVIGMRSTSGSHNMYISCCSFEQIDTRRYVTEFGGPYGLPFSNM